MVILCKNTHVNQSSLSEFYTGQTQPGQALGVACKDFQQALGNEQRQANDSNYLFMYRITEEGFVLFVKERTSILSMYQF